MEAALKDSAEQPHEIPDDSQPQDRKMRYGAVRVEPGYSESRKEPQTKMKQADTLRQENPYKQKPQRLEGQGSVVTGRHRNSSQVESELYR